MELQRFNMPALYLVQCSIGIVLLLSNCVFAILNGLKQIGHWFEPREGGELFVPYLTLSEVS